MEVAGTPVSGSEAAARAVAAPQGSTGLEGTVLSSTRKAGTAAVDALRTRRASKAPVSMPWPSEPATPAPQVATNMLRRNADPQERWRRGITAVVTQQSEQRARQASDAGGGAFARVAHTAFMLRFAPRDKDNRPRLPIRDRKMVRNLRNNNASAIPDEWPTEAGDAMEPQVSATDDVPEIQRL